MPLQEIARRSSQGVDPRVKLQVDRMVSPMLGPIRRLMALSYDASSPAACTILPELADVHRRAGLLSAPEYHLGGYGFSLEESMRKALGESAERAALMTFHAYCAPLLRRTSQQELERQDVAHIPLAQLALFSPQQRAQAHFPFSVVAEQTPITWVPMLDLQKDSTTLLPAQAVLNGFPCQDEARATLVVSTGTATHVNYGRALRGALLELLQIDAAMGHWYSTTTAQKIDVSPQSTPRFAHFLTQYSSWWKREDSDIEFYWLPQPDGIPVYIVICAIRRPTGYPAVAFGLGVSLDLDTALYGAFIEAIPVNFIAMVNGLDRLYGTRDTNETPQRQTKDLQSAYRSFESSTDTDFDSNVGFYALPEQATRLFPARFDPRRQISGSAIRQQVAEIPRDTPFDEANSILFAKVLQKYRIYALDITTNDSKALGYRVVRLFSPDLLALCAPRYPQASHPRFQAYGGFHKVEPHPYP
ncbi:YcaO-like family protein [Dictyobacter kobayashii]|uniref:YcaO domain-containing protein n=1 Tax=Dictyobacter kobayashii TaxID=2014872 RepID=A0A402AQV5_9CHLR|nr:YcaO-like family protein [Dictyobacter kobayashii]GCE21476.1 hypothetical protein KDK_52760 [Dictyobacter kobayashii]